MNQLIQDLMKQTGTDSSGKWMGVEHAKKFAELIVKECLKVAEPLPGIDDQSAICAECICEEIKDHFGM